MLFKDHFGCIVCTIVMLVLGAAMAVVGSAASGTPLTYVGFMHSWGAAFVFNYIAAILLPVADWANAFCRLCKARPGTLVFQLLNTLVLNGVFVTCVTLGMMTVNVGFNEMYWPAFFHMFPILFAAGYVVAFFTGMIAAKIAMAITGPIK
ncbi:MAG: hypothetical protein ACI4F3_02160 [Enterocloster sp.]